MYVAAQKQPSFAFDQPRNSKQQFLSCKGPRIGEDFDSQSRFADDQFQPQQVWGNTPKPRSRSRQQSEISLIEPIRAIKPNYSPNRVEPIDDQSWKLKALMNKMSSYVRKTNNDQ